MTRYRAIRTLRPQGAPSDIYLSSYDPALGVAICRRLAGGESLASICRCDATMPTEKTVWNWTRSHPAFAALKRHALDTARAARAGADTARRAARAASRRAAGHKYRPSGYHPLVTDEICRRVSQGEDLTTICGDPDLPSIATVYNWLRREPAFLAALCEAREVAAAVLVQRATDSASWQGSEFASTRELNRALRAARTRGSHRRSKRLARPVSEAEW